MMQNKILTVLLVLGVNVYGQKEPLPTDEIGKAVQTMQISISTLQRDNAYLMSEVNLLNKKIVLANSIIDSLKDKTEQNTQSILRAESKLGSEITSTKKESDEKINDVGQAVSQKSLYGVLGIILAILITLFLYWFLFRRQQIDRKQIDGELENKTTKLKVDVIAAIDKTKEELQQENIKLDLKLVELLDNQLKEVSGKDVPYNQQDNATLDHSIPLKVADEITRINAYANTLDPNSQDAKALKSSVKRLVNTFKAAQYDIVDLLGQKYDDGMKVTVINEIDDPNLEKSDRVIIRIIKPLVKYKNEQIQAAQVDVATGV